MSFPEDGLIKTSNTWRVYTAVTGSHKSPRRKQTSEIRERHIRGPLNPDVSEQEIDRGKTQV